MPLHKEYRQLWKRAGYTDGAGSAAVVKPPPAGKFRAYYFTSAEYAISNIALGRLKVSRFSDLNDPFELLALKSNRSKARDLSQVLREKYDKESGLICFCKDWMSPPMWSHYAATHRGICLGFDLSRSAVLNVVYEDDRVPDSLPDLPEIDDVSTALRKKLSRTKSTHWEYESEVRIIFPLAKSQKEGNLYFKPFGDDMTLKEVILGPICQLPLAGIRNLVSSLRPGVAVFRSRLAWKTFSVVPMESTIDGELDKEVAKAVVKRKRLSKHARLIKTPLQRGNLKEIV